MWKKIQEFLEKLSQDLDLKDAKQRNKYNNLETPDNLLTIPIIGGLLYIGARIKAGLYWRSKLKRRYMESIQIKEDLRKKKTIYTSIRDSIEKSIQIGKISKISINPDFLGYFLDVMAKDFPNVTVLHDKEINNKFTLIKQDEDQL